MKPGGPEYFCERRVADAQAAGIGAERRHHRALAVAGKTAPLHRTAAGRDPRLGMQMAGDFAGRAGRLVAKHDRADRDFARRPRRRDRTAAPDRDCPKSRSSRAAPARPRWRRGRAPTAGHGRRGHENCRRARSPCADRAARSRPRGGRASPRCRRAAAARRAWQSWSLFPDAGRRRPAGSALPRTARRRDRRPASRRRRSTVATARRRWFVIEELRACRHVLSTSPL